MDYALRDCLQFGTMSLQQAQRIYTDFTTFMQGSEREFVCHSYEQALILSRAYMVSAFHSQVKDSNTCRAHNDLVQRCDQIAWANPTHSALYTLAADAIRKALSKGLIHKADLWRLSCLDFWRSITDSVDSEVRQLASLVRPDLQVEQVPLDTPLGGSLERGGLVISLKNKLRTIDPDVLQRNSQGQAFTKKLSELSPEYKQEREHYLVCRSGEFRLVLKKKRPSACDAHLTLDRYRVTLPDSS